MAKKETIPSLKFEDLKKGQVYRGRNPRTIGFGRMIDDREILYISQHKSTVGHIDHGYTPEFEEWCKNKLYRSLFSESDQIEFEGETHKSAKNIETIMDYTVQYNSPAIKDGSKYPTISATKFLKWAAKNVTETMPENGDWATTL